MLCGFCDSHDWHKPGCPDSRIISESKYKRRLKEFEAGRDWDKPQTSGASKAFLMGYNKRPKSSKEGQR